jgi:hypothetical protein
MNSALLLELGRQAFEAKLLEGALGLLAQPLPFDAFSALITLLGKFSPLLHRRIAIGLGKQVEQLVESYLLDNLDSNIKHCTTEKLFNLFGALSILLKRYRGEKEIKEFKHRIKFDIAIRGFKSELLTRKIQSLNELKEILSHLTRSNALEVLTRKIAEEGVFERLFGPGTHSELIKRSSEFLKFMMTESLLHEKELELLWQCTKTDVETKKMIYKILVDLSFSIKRDQCEFLLRKLFEKSPGIDQDDIELLAELIDSSSFFNEGNYSQIIRFYLEALSSQSIPAEVLETVSFKMSDFINRLSSQSERALIVQKCFENLATGTNPLLTLKVLKRMIKPDLQKEAVEGMQLCYEKLLELRRDKYPQFVAEFSERLNFIYFLFVECRDYLDRCFEMLQRLVEEFILSEDEREKGTFFSWFEKILRDLNQAKTSPEYINSLFAKIREVPLANYNE